MPDRTRSAELTALTSIAAQVNCTQDLAEILAGALQTTLEVIGEEAGEIFLLDDETGDLHLHTHRGVSEAFAAEEATVGVGECLCGQAVLSGETVAEFRVMTRAHQFEARVAAPLPLVWADPRRARQVLRNLVENAVKYSPQGGPITLTLEPRDECVRVGVADQGLGIEPQHLDHIFDRFYQVDSASTRKVGGAGKANLGSSGYKVLTAADGQEAIETVDRELPDLVVLDLMLPKLDGYAVCRRIREFSAVPVIMLTARSAEVDLLHGFDVGADDYLTKPFAVNELLVRVQAVLRRSKWPEEIVARQGFRAGPIEIDFAQHRVTVSGKAVKLTPTEYRLLAYLTSNANRVIVHRELLRAVWGPEYGDETEYLRVYMRYLRQKLEPEPSKPRYLLTQPGAGYMFYQPEEERQAVGF